jgi:hypothetical protein
VVDPDVSNSRPKKTFPIGPWSMNSGHVFGIERTASIRSGRSASVTIDAITP